MVHRCLGQKTRKRGRSRYKQEKEEEEVEKQQEFSRTRLASPLNVALAPWVV